jgi:hypothetical protein
MAEESEPSLFQFLTRKEFKLCWTLALMESFEEYRGTFPLMAFFSPGETGRADDWGEEIRRAIRFLKLDKGYEFENLEVEWNGSMTPKGPMTKEGYFNQMFQVQLSTGSMPDPLVACKEALSYIEERSIPLDTDPIIQFMNEVASEKDRMKEVLREIVPEESRKEVDRLRVDALAQLGVAVVDKGDTRVN